MIPVLGRPKLGCFVLKKLCFVSNRLSYLNNPSHLVDTNPKSYLFKTSYLLQVRRVRHEAHLCHRETDLDEVPQLLRQLSDTAGRVLHFRRKNFSRVFEAPKVD